MGLREFLREWWRDERGVTQTIEQALLIAATIAAFFVLVINPVASVVNFVWNLPEWTDMKFQDFIDWLKEKIGWGKVDAGNSTMNATAS